MSGFLLEPVVNIGANFKLIAELISFLFHFCCRSFILLLPVAESVSPPSSSNLLLRLIGVEVGLYSIFILCPPVPHFETMSHIFIGSSLQRSTCVSKETRGSETDPHPC